MSAPLIESTAAITITTPEYVTGTIYTDLVSSTGQIFDPIETVVISSTGLVNTDPVSYANTIVGDVSVVWSYLSYGQNLEPGLVSLQLLIAAYFTVMLVKLILSVVMYVKQLVANWL